MTDENTTDFFDGIGEGAGAPTAVLKNPGDFVHGEIVRMTKRDYVPFGKTEPEKHEGTDKNKQGWIDQDSFIRTLDGLGLIEELNDQVRET